MVHIKNSVNLGKTEGWRILKIILTPKKWHAMNVHSLQAAPLQG
jgi:hypothetical protein